MYEALLEPNSVAVIGASRTPGKVGYEILTNLKDGGFEGAIIPINPSSEEVYGIKCYPDLSSYGKKIDMAIIVIPAPFVTKAVECSIAAGAKAIIIITAGFNEVGEEGARLQEEIAAICKAGNVDLLGPNCLGLINAHHKLNASFASHMPKPGGISVISQSGALCTAMLDWAVSRDLGLAKLISMGNKADLSETDFLSALASDPATKVVVGYLESIDSGNAFMKAAEAASLKKPVVMFKAGVTQAGSRAASSHTGSMAGADMAYGAAFKRSGIIRADTFEALFDYAMALAMQPLPKGDNVAIITNAGGPGIMAADAVELSGMSVCTLQGASASALKSRLPSAASVGNPIDLLGDADSERYVMAVEAAQDDDTVDSIVVILTPQAMTQPVETAKAIAACAKHQKPILVSFMGGLDVFSGREELLALNLPDYPSPERAVAALKAMSDYSAWLRRPPRVLTRFLVNRRRVSRIINRHLKTGQPQVGEAQAKEILRAYGFNVPLGRMATTADEAIEAAQKIGFPIAMKISSPDVIHKSDLGGVKLNLDSDDEVRDAFDLMTMRIRQRVPKARIEGVYVEQMCKRGREVILGMTRDPQFGPMLMFGLGGIFVEVMKDVTFHIAPITEREAMQMLENTKSFALLKGVRGQASADLAAIATSLQRISQLVTDFTQIAEMDINPFIVGKMGDESIAADARITLAERPGGHE
ncbi:MAG: CoA-binding protein [Lentisphaerales bacterium]|nr:MAG: CoA-binding protein [Lentisphaerales bacterium]